MEVTYPDGRVVRGYLMSRYELAAEGHLTLKLRNGYNIGVALKEGFSIRKIGRGARPVFTRPPPAAQNPALPRVSVMSTGGTIASRVDYRTGAVRAALSSEDLVSLFPELLDVAYIEAEVLFSIFSENMTYREWEAISRKVDEKIREGASGVVIAHGTDTMHYTAAALSFALRRPPIPVVLVGAQRSSDRPSSDSALNLMAAVTVAARAVFGEVVVAMHEWHSDDVVAIHRGTRVVKMHTSSRDAFRSVNAKPLAYYRDGGIVMNDPVYNPRGSDGYEFKPGYSGKASLIKFYPSMAPDYLDYLIDRGVRGVIIEGTGLGHVASSWLESIRRATREGVFVGMTSQCRYGRVNMYVYDTGRDLMKAGATPLGDMLPETALVKLMWVLARETELERVRELMETPLAGELSLRMLPLRVRPERP